MCRQILLQNLSHLHTEKIVKSWKRHAKEMPSLVTGQPNRTSTHSMLTSMLASFEITETVKMTGKTLIGHDEAFSSSDMTNLPVKSISIDLTNDNFNQSINQSIKNYIVPLQDPYSEVLPIQAKQKRIVLRRLWNWEQAPFGRSLGSIGRPFQVVGPTHRKRMGPPNYREKRTAVYDGIHKKKEGGIASIW